MDLTAQTNETLPARIFVSGHRNPDIDSIASAVALAELRRRTDGLRQAQAICPGLLPERARYLFQRFQLPVPQVRADVYVRVRDIMVSDLPMIQAGTTLWSAFQTLRASGYDRLPTVDAEGRYLGMLSPMALLDHFLNFTEGDSAPGVASREIESSVDLIAQVLRARILTGSSTSAIRKYSVYVAAMQVSSFEKHIPTKKGRNLALIAGDRSEIHLRALQHHVKLLIVTGNMPVEPLILTEAKRCGMAILQCPDDSATIIRRLPFTLPVEKAGFRGLNFVLTPSMKLRSVADRINNHFEDVIPVVQPDKRLAGVVLKKSMVQTPPFGMILVDHNEPEQSLPGVEDLPVLEIVDHHRLRVAPTDNPIRFTADVVGSTCTLVAAMYQARRVKPSAALAGLLLAGVVTDTMGLRSPTTTPRDVEMAQWLTKIAGVSGEELLAELARIASPLAGKPPLEVLNADRKNYTEGAIAFALAQIEESNLELLTRRREELASTMRERMQTERLAFIGLLVTDPVQENSRLLLVGGERLAKVLPWPLAGEDIYDLPGIVSRKKQLLPQILAAVRTL